jgi:hypothetical protein
MTVERRRHKRRWPLKQFGDRAHLRGQHDGNEVARQRFIAILMVATGLLRVLIWFLLILLYAVGVPFARHLYTSVAFVSLLSVGALLLTDWSQVAASLAQLTAGDSHHDVEFVRDALNVDFAQMDRDLDRLAELAGRPAHELADDIRRRLG